MIKSLFKCSWLDGSVFSALAFIPAIMEHLNLQLLAIELNSSIMASSIDTRCLFSALIGRSSLMDTDYERLEFFGKIQTIKPLSFSMTLD